jgi:hypothetical protein
LVRLFRCPGTGERYAPDRTDQLIPAVEANMKRKGRTQSTIDLVRCEREDPG